MRFSRLVDAVCQTQEGARVLGHGDPEVRSIHYRAQQVKPGGLFVAVAGTAADGHDFVGRAVEAGAAALVVNRPTPDAGLPQLVAEDTRAAMAVMAHEFFGHPSRELVVVGITGTNAKTTVSYLLEAVFAEAGFSPGVVGTVETRWKGHARPSAMTTPESVDLAGALRRMADAGTTHAILEVSSHALHQGRVREVAFDCGLFTNLSQDHLDYHQDLEAYFAAKKLLFTRYLEESARHKRTWGVVNADDPYGRRLLSEAGVPTLSVGMESACEVQGRELSVDHRGIRGKIVTPAGEFALTSPLVGRHNFYNLLCAAGAALALGIDPPVIARGLCRVENIPGRLQRVEVEGCPTVLVDYAHTPAALEKVIQALKPLCKGRLFTVFGA
ncbi:MAG: UDP-N-acetylmuramoyl-L-alanyl-D-glutamate--2,6-diaminopimelate ligase, partial [Deltaproteobacteria bacterium]|nr:UDP-N-acetylmuramoyl-L-alanyl-D-glutamate--2,6-diaminopimelate ligase [Deltaproteobacteria bacterium]